MHLNKIAKIADDFIKRHQTISHKKRFFYGYKHVFYKKKPAYEYSNKHGKLPIFSVDISDTEAKKGYVVTGYCKWLEDYKTISPDKRYAYEVVLPDVPCHLYVDIEAEFSSNDEIRDAIEKRFVELMKELRRFMYYSFIASPELLQQTKFIVLDSSKSTKFSKHSIVKIPNVLFKNNYHCGAFIRKFQIHILTKFGPKETNPYFVFPENEDKKSPEFKQFLIDMGVYTKGRDFRLLASYKRAGNTKKQKKRFLWLNDSPNSMTDKQFFDTLIQFQPKPSTIKYHVSHIYDTINNGIPVSSSLRTVRPIGNSTVRTISTQHGAKRFKSVSTSLPSWIIRNLAQKITNMTNTIIVGIKSSGSSFFFNTTSKTCEIKSKLTKTHKAQHSKNSIYFILFATTGIVVQSCFNQTYCFDTNTGKHRMEKIFTIRDEHICKGLIDWCDINGFEWKGDDFIPDSWMGTDEDF